VTERPHILFVDDEPRILGGIRRMLRTYRDRWDMSFAEGGEAALAALRERPCDVIVSDYRMPGMDGAGLLERVRSDYPGTARVILSGQTNEENLLGIMVLAHEILTKPSTPEQLVDTLERLVDVRRTAAGEGNRRDLVVIESLPSPPRTLVDLVAALNADDASAESVGLVIERDPAATAKVLQLVNSSAYSAGRTVSNVPQAVALLGLHTVRGLVLMHDLIRTFDPAGALPVDWIESLSAHALETSRLARMLAAGREWESQAFTAGLLYEVGQLALACSQPAEFGAVLDAWRQSGAATAGEPEPLRIFELGAFGVSHVEVGENLLRLWGLPDPVTGAVAGHAACEPPCAAGDVTSAVALAHLIVETEAGPVCGPHRPAAVLDESALGEAEREAVARWRAGRARG
jgi:HD-like signal output (HDOD) protein/CheY-like chemotaxis protein